MAFLGVFLAQGFPFVHVHVCMLVCIVCIKICEVRPAGTGVDRNSVFLGLRLRPYIALHRWLKLISSEIP